jgi:methylated-DNA-[protein]-cysteine S-methyltransferase
MRGRQRKHDEMERNMEEICYRYIESPIGRLLLAGTQRSLLRIEFANGKGVRGPRPEWREDRLGFADVVAQLSEYFAGRRREFELPLDPVGTEFQQRTWSALRRIPYGVTASYGDIARAIGKPTAVRAVGAANGRNPLPIVIPCHRVIGSDGSLTGFGGGTDVKRALLRIEGSLL